MQYIKVKERRETTKALVEKSLRVTLGEIPENFVTTQK